MTGSPLQGEGALPAEDGDPAVAFTAGTRLLQLNQPEAACEQLAKALALAPDVAAIHNNLAAALLQLGEASEALMIARQGLGIEPAMPQLINTAANALRHLGRLQDAAAVLEQGCRLAPDAAPVALNYADTLVNLGRTGEALAVYDRLIAREPLPAAHVGRALLHHIQGRFEQADGDFGRALALDPGNAPALNGRGILLMDQGDWHQALSQFLDLAHLHPTVAEAHANLGQTLQAMGRHDEAVQAFDKAFAIKPLGDRVAPYLMQSLMYQCAWSRLDPVEEAIFAEIERCLAADEPMTVPPFVLAPTRASAPLRIQVAKAYSRRLEASVLRTHEAPRYAFRRDRGERLRVGFVSPDFRRHSVGIAMADLMAAFDRRRFHWIAYSTGRDAPDDMTEHFRRDFNQFRDLSRLSPMQAAKSIHGDEVDVLVDLAGHTRNSGLDILALRPAPVQAHYLGYGSTLGADWISYLITDPAHTPSALAPHCSESLVFLPDTFMAASRHEIDCRPWSRADAGLPDDGLVLASFNAPYKLHPRLFDLWMRLLCRLPGATLWLKSGGAEAVANLRLEAERRGVDPARLVFAERLPHGEHLARHAVVDLALDTFPHGGGVTTLDALWAGVPVLTLAGETHSSRTGASILTAAGLPQLIADSNTAYEDMAYGLAKAPGDLRALTAQVAAARDASPLFRPARLARHLERAFEMMWQRWADGLPPDDIHIPSIA